MMLSTKYADRSTLRVEEVAEILTCTSQHVTDMIEECRLIAVNIGTNRKALWRISAGDLIRFMKGDKRTP